MKKLIYGKRPMMFVQDWNVNSYFDTVTRVRIVMPNGTCFYSDISGYTLTFRSGCTSARSQLASVRKIKNYFKRAAAGPVEFLGYL